MFLEDECVIHRSMASLSKQYDGVFLVDKPDGMTSFDVLRKFKSFGIKDVGHGGTLDPFATGLLLVFSGRALRLSEYYLKSAKEYSATLQFGQTTASGDLTNPVIETTEKIPSSLQEIELAAQEFCSHPYLQTPPMFSAKKVDGKKLYELARQGKEIEREPVLCRIKDFYFTDYDPQTAIARFSVHVSSGTYIRTLAQDFARSMHSLGMLTALRRTQSGVFHLQDGISLDSLIELLSAGEHVSKGFYDIHRLARMSFAVIDCDERTREMAFNGQQEKLFHSLSPQLKALDTETEIASLFYQDCFFGMIKRSPDQNWIISKIFRE